VSKIRRFRCESLAGVAPGAEIALPPEEARHARVLRLEPGDAVLLFDSAGSTTEGRITRCESGRVFVEISGARGVQQSGLRITLAVAWPKGKRAGVMVEKCAELGAHCIAPVRYERSVVSKDDESEGLTRLRRIAVEAAKQCGRNDTVEIAPEMSLAEFLKQRKTDDIGLVLDPGGKIWLYAALNESVLAGANGVTLFVGPAGGLTGNELALLSESRCRTVRLADNVLRIETAAVAACAAAHMFLGGKRL
jgi:16S rRNA (uracil1498-N3)-methyltransferase